MARARFKNLTRLKAKLLNLREATADKVKPAMEGAAQAITDTMRRFAPVDEGALRDSIGWTWGDAPKGSISMSHKIGTLSITIFAGNEEAFYARWIEFGTAPHNTAKGGGNKSFQGEGRQHPGAPARPFFFPAYRAHKKKVKADIRKAITAAVKEAVR
jgi:HK97 gp10 family phage protein